MPGLDFASYPLWLNLAVFAAGAAIVWYAGTKLAQYADEVSAITGFGRALVGAVLMAGVTSMPEIATTFTAALGGAAPLAVNNMLGSVALQVAVLAVGDAVLKRQALSAVLPDPSIMLQAVLGILLLSVVPAAMLVGEAEIFGVGAWSLLLAVLYGLSMWLLAGEQAGRAWRLVRLPEVAHGPEAEHGGSLQQALALVALTAVIILAAGFVLTRTSEALAEQTGLGQNFVGVLFLALSTSLPEVSSVIGAVRRGRFEMAYGDIFGTNLLNMLLIFVTDLLYAGPPVLQEAGSFAAFAAMLAIMLKAIALIGILERRDTTVARLGIDSIAIAVVYLGGLVLLYQLR